MVAWVVRYLVVAAGPLVVGVLGCRLLWHKSARSLGWGVVCSGEGWGWFAAETLSGLVAAVSLWVPLDGSVWPVLPVPWVLVSGPALVGEGVPLVQVDGLLGGSGGI